MANSIFKLVGSVFVETNEADKNLDKTKDKAEKTGVSFGQVAGKAAAIGTAVVAGSAAAVSGIISLASASASTADEIDKASIRMGISAESYQEYAHAAGLAGVETSTLESAAKKLEGTGINFDDAIDSIMSLGTEEERSAKAAELFGDSVAYKMSPMIEQSADAFYEAKKEAKDLGLVMSNDSVKSGAKLNDTLTKVKESFTAIVTKLGTSLMPVVEKVADWILEYMPMFQNLFEQFAPILADLFDKLVPPLMEIVDKLLPVIVELINTIVPILVEVVEAIFPIIIQFLDIFLPIIVELVQKLLPPFMQIILAILPIFTKILDVIGPILDILMELIDPFAEMLEMLAPLITSLITLVFEILEPFIPIIKLIAKVLVAVLGTAMKVITGLISGIITAINWVVEKIQWLKENWENIWSGVGNFFVGIKDKIVNTFTSIRDKIVNIFTTIRDKIKSIIEGLKEAFKTPINWIIDKLNAVFEQVNKVKIPDWIPLIGGKGFNIPLIPKLATGGIVEQEGQIFQARENGPELVASYGGKSAVMNNEQIVDAVSRGVADAVARVLNGSGLADDIASAIASSPIIAKISASDVFDSVRNSNRNFVEMTGRSAFS